MTMYSDGAHAVTGVHDRFWWSDSALNELVPQDLHALSSASSHSPTAHRRSVVVLDVELTVVVLEVVVTGVAEVVVVVHRPPTNDPGDPSHSRQS